jgi:hypothetical protein
MPPCRAHQALPATPCLSLARPRLARHALPRSASPTSPNQQRQASSSTGAHALPASPGLAVPSKPCLPRHFQPDRIAHHRATPRLHCLSRSFRATPCLPCLPRPPGLAVPT